jgi:hypothetical protein
MQVHHKSCGAAIVATLCALSFPSLSSADVLACRGPKGTMTYTNGDCAKDAQVRVVMVEPRPAFDDQPRMIIRETGWARPVKVRNRRPDVLAIHEAKLKLERMDAERRHRRYPNATQLAEYRE